MSSATPALLAWDRARARALASLSEPRIGIVDGGVSRERASSRASVHVLGEGFRKQSVKRFARVEPLAEILSLVRERLVGEGCQGRFELINAIHRRAEAFDLSLVLTAKNQIQQAGNHSSLTHSDN